jgi:hypothetical protein
MAQTGLPLKKIREWFENRNSNLTRRVGQKVIPGYGKNTKYVKTMTEAYEKDPEGYVEKLLAGTINLQTGEKQRPSPYGTQPRGHAHPVLVRRAVLPDGVEQIDLVNAGKMRPGSAPIQIDAPGMMLNGLVPNDSFSREVAIIRARENRSLPDQISGSLPPDRRADCITPAGDDFAQQQLQKYLRPTQQIIGQQSMHRNESIEPMNGNLAIRGSYASSSKNLSMAPKFHQQTSRDVTPNFQNIKKEDSLDEQVGLYYHSQIGGRPEYPISSDKNSFGASMPGDFQVIPQRYVESLRRFIDGIPANRKSLYPENDRLSNYDGDKYEVGSPGMSRHPFYATAGRATASKDVYSCFPKLNPFNESAPASDWQKQSQGPQITADSKEFAASAGLGNAVYHHDRTTRNGTQLSIQQGEGDITKGYADVSDLGFADRQIGSRLSSAYQANDSRMIHNGVGVGAHTSDSALQDNYHPTRLANTFQNQRIIQRTGAVKKDCGIGSSKASIPKLANADPNGVKSENNIEFNNLTSKDFTHGENYDEIIDLVTNDSESDESITTYKEVPFEIILDQDVINHSGANKTNWNQDQRLFLAQNGRSPSYARQRPFPSFGTSMEGNLEPSHYDGTSIHRSHPQAPRALVDVTYKRNGNIQTARGRNENDGYSGAAVAVSKSLKRARQVETPSFTATLDEESEMKKLRVRQTTSL